MIDKAFGGLVRRLVLKAGYRKLDAYMTKRYPAGWPAVCEALKGWKVLTAVFLLHAPALIASAEAALRDAGMNPASVLGWTATGLLVVGAIDKVLKLFVGFEFGQDVLKVKDEPVRVRSVPVLKNEEEHEAFWNGYRHLRDRGVPFNEAREEALKVVLAERKE